RAYGTASDADRMGHGHSVVRGAATRGRDGAAHSGGVRERTRRADAHCDVMESDPRRRVMPSLHDLQRRFADALLSPEAAIDFVAGASTLARDRIAIYRRTICANYRKALAATYPVVKRLTGSSFFHAAVDDFVNERPSRSGDLNIYGQDFGDFLDKYAPAEDLPYLGDVARLEWAIDEAPRAADRSRTPDSVLASLAAARLEHLPSLRLELHPSSRLVHQSYPIIRIW